MVFAIPQRRAAILAGAPVSDHTPWYNASWGFRRKINVSNAGASTLTDYQQKINLTSDNINADGSDLRVTDSDGTTLIDHYLTSWSSGSGVLWAKVPSVPSGGTHVYVYYGNAAATSVAVTFDSMFSKSTVTATTLALWNADTGSGTTAPDGSGNGHTLTLANVTWGATDGGGQDDTQSTFSTGSYLVLNGTTAHAYCTGLLDTPPDEFTILGWFRLDATLPTTDVQLFNKRTGNSPSNLFGVSIRGTSHTAGALNLNWTRNGATYTIDSAALTWTVGTWYHLALVSGVEGTKLYRNGVLACQLYNCAGLIAGTYQPFRIGVAANGTSGFFHGAVDAFRIETRAYSPVDVVRDLQRSVMFGNTLMAERWSAPATIFSASQAWQNNAVQEPSIIDESGTLKMWYRGSLDASASAALGYATSTDNGDTWTDYASNPVAGEGGSGIAGYVDHPFVFHDGTQYVCYYVAGAETPGNLAGINALTSDDGIVWTHYADDLIPMVDSTWETTGGNCCVIEHATGEWWMWYEAEGAVGGVTTWRIGFATAPTSLGPWTKYASNPLTTLGWGYNAGGPTMPYVDGSGVLHLWVHARQFAASGESESGLHHATSSDGITWTMDSASPYASIDESIASMHLVDPTPIQVGSDIHLYYDTFGTGYNPHILRATFTGTFAELVATTSAPAANVGSQQRK